MLREASKHGLNSTEGLRLTRQQGEIVLSEKPGLGKELAETALDGVSVLTLKSGPKPEMNAVALLVKTNAKQIAIKTLKNAITADFYTKANKLDIRERIAVYKQTAAKFAAENGLTPNKELMKKNKGRTIYSDADGTTHYSLDTQHGRFEVLNAKGKHSGEIDFSGKQTKGADATGGHDIEVKKIYWYERRNNFQRNDLVI